MFYNMSYTNYLFIGFSIFYVFFGIYKSYQENKTLKRMLEQEKYKAIFSSKSIFLLFAICLISSAYIMFFQNDDFFFFGISCIIFAIVIVECFSLKTNHLFYYNDKKCIINNEIIKFRKINKLVVEKTKLGFKKYFIHYFNNEKIKINKKIYLLLKNSAL